MTKPIVRCRLAGLIGLRCTAGSVTYYKRTDPPSLNAKASQIPVDAFKVSSSRLSRGSEQSYDMFSIALIKLNHSRIHVLVSVQNLR